MSTHKLSDEEGETSQDDKIKQAGKGYSRPAKRRECRENSKIKPAGEGHSRPIKRRARVS
jgi:hypothetical protein